VRACGDKATLIEVSRAAGLAGPESAVCHTSAEAADSARRIGYPVIVKAARSARSDGTMVRQRPTRVVYAEHELPAATSDAAGAMLVQRFERPRAHLSCGGVATDEGVTALTVVRFHRTWPVQSGAAAFAETVDAPPGLHEKVGTLVERLGWRGIFELEVLALDGDRFCAIDFNPRVFGWLALAVEAGADLPHAMIEALLRGRTVAARPRAGVRYRWEDADVCYAAWQLRRGHVRAAGRALRPARGVTHAHFRLDDPAPLAARLAWVVSRRARPA
jgi:biotin carboxylase